MENQGWYKRLVEEKEELTKKLYKLNHALETNQIPKSKVEVLTRQSKAMRVYLSVLNERIG